MMPSTHARSFRSLGTGCSVVVCDDEHADVSLATVHRYLDRIDLACSRFRDDSELSRLNANAGRWTSASELFIEALETSIRAASLTNGIVDPTIGNALYEIGYDRDFDLIVDSGPLRVSLNPIAGWERIELDVINKRVRIPSGTRLDLGATAKALAADNAAKLAAMATGSGVLVNLGGDIAVAGAGPAEGWQVGIAPSHAAGPNEVDAVVALHAGGLATSSTSVRSWTRGGAAMHHIIDPHSRMPAREVWHYASVAAASCVDANIASTAAIILGDEAPDWLAQHDLDARLVSINGSVFTFGSWPAEVAA